MRAYTPLAASAVLAVLGGGVACQSVEAPGPGVVISPAVPFLVTEVNRALASLREAREELPASGSRAGESLDEAEAALVRIQSYYLPLLEARQRASNAREFAVGGELQAAESELGHIETTLLDLARTGGADMSRQVAEPLDLVEEARLALTRSSPDAPARLADLAERLELLLLKGELVLE